MRSGIIIILTILTIAVLLLSTACPSTVPPTKGAPATPDQEKAAETEATPPSPPEPKPVEEVPSSKDKPLEDVKPSPTEEKTDGADQPSPQAAEKAPPEPEVLPDYPLTVVDDLDRKVTIKKLPQRIISLAPSNTEILFALGLEDRVVGVTQYCNYPEAAKTKPRVAGYSTPSLEKVISLEPDLILADAIHEKTVLPTLEKHELTVIVMAAKSIDTVLDDITLVGKVTGKSKAAAQLVDGLNARISAVTAKTQSLTSKERPRILHILWHNPIWTMGSETFIDDLLQKAGGG
ncbi:ABC transporter substrate-binding protein [Chloroflexota bacterium]